MSDQSAASPSGASIAAAFADLGIKVRELRPDLAATTPAAQEDTGVDNALSAALVDVRRRAAMVGWFKPTQVVDSVVRRLRERVLTALVAECDIQSRGRDRYWRLALQPRRDELQRIAQDDKARAHALRETSRLAQDTESRWLRQLLGGKSIDPKRVTRRELPTLLQVGEWTEHILPNAPKTADVRGLLAQQAIEDSLGVLLHRFHGRETELSTLRRFAGHSARSGRVPVFGVSGIGGVGKSTLLARFAASQLKHPTHKRGVVLIDFDRARFWSGDPIALTFELTRQIAAWFPELAASLTELRNNVRRNLLSSGFAEGEVSATSSAEALGRSTSEINHLLGSILRRGRIGMKGMRPLVVILDTFELMQGTRSHRTDEVGSRGVDAVAAWADELYLKGDLKLLRIIVAGRAPISEDSTFGPRLTEPELQMNGLDKASSQAVLRDFGLTARDARLVIEAVGDAEGLCNPLILRLAGRLVKSKTVRASALKDESGKGRKDLDQELVQGMLYQRILEHIDDRDRDNPLAAVAHPGLVLRRVTAELIQEVLFPVMKVKVLTPDTTARDLFNRLRREVWLVQDAGNNAVMHRLDLRRTMLRLIDADRKSTAQKIHRKAIKYYASGREPYLSAEMAAGEAFYHRLMLMTPAQAARLQSAEVRRFESSLFLTLDDLPPHVAGVVKSILDRPVTDEEGASLPEPHRKDFVARQGRRHLLNDEPYRALKLLEAEPDLHPDWELRALALTVNWDLARKRGLLTPSERLRPGYSAMVSRFGGETPVTEELAGEVLEPWNLASCIWFNLGEPRQAIAVSTRLLSGFDSQADWGKLPVRSIESLARAVTYRTAAARDAAVTTRIEQPIPWRRLNESQLGTTSMALEATRHAVLAESEEDPWDHVVVLSGENIPPSFRLLKGLYGSRPPLLVNNRLRQLEKTLRSLKQAPSGHILGTIARAFTRTMVVRPSEWAHGAPAWGCLCANPEFRGPAKFALLEAFTTQKDFEQMADAAWSLMDLRPTDLRPDAFAAAAARPGRAGLEIANLLLYVDRLSMLSAFLSRLNTLKPRRTKLALVTAAFERWDRALMPHAAATVPRRAT